MKISCSRSALSSVFLVIVPCFLFLFECILGNKNIEIAVLLLSLGILLSRGKFNFSYTWQWALYLFSILLSLFFRDDIKLVSHDAIIILLLICLVIFSSGKCLNYLSSAKLLFGIGIVNAFFVILQFLMGQSFNIVFWKHFTSSWYSYATRYFFKHYYSGIQAVPGEAAGLIAFACLYLFAVGISRRIGHNRWKFSQCLMVPLLLALLLTGKKGVLLGMIVAIFIEYCIIYLNKRQWIKMLKMLTFVFLMALISYYFVITHQNVSFFVRINTFVQQLQAGDDYSTGRIHLFNMALTQWKQHPFLGMGWRSFREYSSIFFNGGMHDVNFDYLQFLCENGIIGFILMMIPILITVRRAIALQKVISSNSVIRNRIILFAVSIQYFTLIYAFFEVPFYDRVFFSVYVYSSIVINSCYKDMQCS